MQFHAVLVALSVLSSVAASPTGPSLGVVKRAPVDEASVNLVKNSKWSPYSVGSGYTGRCGRFIYTSEFGVSLSMEDFRPALCNRIVSLTYGERHTYSQILDVCTDCAKGDLNLTEHLFKFFSPDLTTPIIGEWELGND